MVISLLSKFNLFSIDNHLLITYTQFYSHVDSDILLNTSVTSYSIHIIIMNL